MASVLVIDDEEMTLTSLRSLFTLETDYDIACFTNPVRARRELEHTPVDVVISDYLMPELNGVDLLKDVRRLQPEAVRILLTGFADKENAIRAINEVGLYQYIEKPWDNQQMLVVIRNALQEKSLRRELAEKVKALDQLLWEHKQLAESHSYLRDEIEMAVRVQMSLLPDRLPEIDDVRICGFCQFCRSLGGDFYDVAVNHEHAILLVADVCGHGAQAALTCMLLKASFQESAARARGPDDLLSQMNTTLYRFLPAGSFVAGALLWVDRRRSTMKFSNAGLPYPFVLNRAEGRTDQILLPGFPLGMFEGSELESYEAREILLAPGNVMLIASDGLGDIANPDGELFEERELKQALADLGGTTADELIQGLMERATRFSGASHLPDDVTLLTVTRIPSSRPM
jgi:serine phosphatase RsbU (regulator of sigma subunit)